MEEPERSMEDYVIGGSAMDFPIDSLLAPMTGDFIPTRRPMIAANVCYVSSSRTTLCDIMCTVNASVLFGVPPPPDKLKTIIAVLPYNKTSKNLKHATVFQKYKMEQNKKTVVGELRRERELFFWQLDTERADVEERKRIASTKMQALYRGHKKRPPSEYQRATKVKHSHTQNNMQDELCTMAAKLGLKPIDGLSLETRLKTSRRKEKIQDAAAFRLHRFFSMSLQKMRAIRILQERRHEIIQDSARMITRAVRYVKVKRFVKQCEAVKRKEMSLKIQCRARIFQARESVRVKGRERLQTRKQNEACIIIQRNFAPKHRAYNLARATLITIREINRLGGMVADTVGEVFFEHAFEQHLDEYVHLVGSRMDQVLPTVIERILEGELEQAVVTEMREWLQMQMLAILEENQRFEAERKKLEVEVGVLSMDLSAWAVDECPSPRAAPGSAEDSDRPKSANVGHTARERAVLGRAMLRLSSIDMNHSLKFMAAMEAAKTAAFSDSAASSPLPSFSAHCASEKDSGTVSLVDGVGEYVGGLISQSIEMITSRPGTAETPMDKAAGDDSMAFEPPVEVGVEVEVGAEADVGAEAAAEVAKAAEKAADAEAAVQAAAEAAAVVAAEAEAAAVVQAVAAAAAVVEVEAAAAALAAAAEEVLVARQKQAEADAEAAAAVETAAVVAAEAEAAAAMQAAAAAAAAAAAVVEAAAAAAAALAAAAEEVLVARQKQAEADAEAVAAVKAAAAVLTAAAVQAAAEIEAATQAQMEAAVAAEAAAAVAAAAVAAAAAEAAAVVEAVAGTAERQAATTVASDSIKAGVQIVSRPGTAETPMDKAVGDDSMAFEPPVEAGVEVEVGAEAGVEVGAEAGVKAEARVEAEAGVGSPGPRPTTTSSDAAPPHPLTSEDSSSDASEIASNYSEVASAPTHTMLDWEVTADFSISLSQADRKTIDQTFKDALYAFYRARYQRSSDILERFLPILAAFPSQDPFHPDVARIQSTIKTLSGRILLAQGRFPEAQEVFEDALQHRVEVFGKQHFLCVELLQYLAELHCLRADYDKGEVLYEQALGVVDALGGKNSHGVQIRLQQAKTRILVGRADLLTQRGQYYTASGVLSRAQEGLALLGGDVESLEIQEKFVTVWVDLLVVRGKRGQAVSLLQELLDTRRLRYGPQHPSIAASLIALADVKLAGCEFAQAAELVEEGLSMYRLAHVPAASNTSSPVSAASATTLSAAAHPAIATALLLRGRAFAQLGRYGDATADVLLSLDMRREALGSAHPLVALSTHVLADIEAQNPLRAQANLTLALKSLRTCLGQKHHLVGDCLFSLATNAEVRGAYLEAAAFHEEALEVREAIVQLLGKDMPSGIAGIPEGAEGTEGMGVGAEGTEGMGAGAGVVGVVGVGLEGPTMHIDIEVSRLHLGRVYGMLSRFPQAKIMLKNAVKNITSLVGNRHTLVARALLFLGELCCRRGNHADAKQLYCLSFNILQELFGDHHPSIAEVLLASAENLRLPGLYPEALDLQLSAYDLSAHVHGNDSLAVAQALFLRAQMLRDGGQTAEAERAFVRAVHVVLQRLGEGGLYGVMLGEFAECCRVIGNLAQAEKYFKRSLEVQRAAAGESLGVLCTLLNLSLLLMDMHRPAEAADILSLGVLPPLQELLGAAHPTSMYAKANLALAVSFARFEVGEGTIVLEALLSHPDVKAFVTQCGTSLAPAHPWLTRFAEGGTVLSTARSEGSSLVTANVPSGKDSLIPSQSQGPSYSETDSTGPGTPVPKGALTGYGDAVSPIPEHGVEEGAQVRKGIQGVQGGERGGWGEGGGYDGGSLEGSLEEGSLDGDGSYTVGSQSYSQSQSYSRSQSYSQSQSQSYGYSESQSQYYSSQSIDPNGAVDLSARRGSLPSSVTSRPLQNHESSTIASWEGGLEGESQVGGEGGGHAHAQGGSYVDDLLSVEYFNNSLTHEHSLDGEGDQGLQGGSIENLLSAPVAPIPAPAADTPADAAPPL